MTSVGLLKGQQGHQWGLLEEITWGLLKGGQLVVLKENNADSLRKSMANPSGSQWGCLQKVNGDSLGAHGGAQGTCGPHAAGIKAPEMSG